MSDDLPDLFFLLAGPASAALVFTIYHVSIRCNRSVASAPTPAGPQQLDRLSGYEDGPTPAGWTVMTTTVRNYDKAMGLVGGDDRMCVVCLGEFEEGDELSTLLYCMHSFHVACIDTWLHSRMNCPLCRSLLSVMISGRQQDL